MLELAPRAIQDGKPVMLLQMYYNVARDIISIGRCTPLVNTRRQAAAIKINTVSVASLELLRICAAPLAP